MGVDDDARRRLEYAVALILAETETAVEVYRRTLAAIGHELGWAVGAVWEVQGDVLRCALTWHRADGAPAFERVSGDVVLSRDVGLPGRVWSTGEPAWISDVTADANFPRASAARNEGLHAALCFPLRSASGVVGVMELFTHEPVEPDARLLASLEVIGSQVGQVVERRRAEQEAHALAVRLQAMLAAALDAVVTIDHEGLVRGWNDAAEQIFGYAEKEVVGRELAELIVPPSLREAHRRGLARYLATEQPMLLDRRVEITGVDAGGREFPIELTITRVSLPGRPLFTGFLRDISDRKAAEGALRASRARLVDVADAERRRIQRNLHDGAQQRLTSTLITLGRLRQWVGVGQTANELLNSATDELTAALHELRELANGMHPPVLSERGLAEALRALALRAPVRVDLLELPDRRLPEGIEAAAYYVVSEALANVQKHAGAKRVSVRAALRGNVLSVEIADDGGGGAQVHAGTGLLGLIDRVEAIGGRIELESPHGGGTRLAAAIPVGHPPEEKT